MSPNWSLHLGILKTRIQNVHHKCVYLHEYKIQRKHEIQRTDYLKCVAFASEILGKVDDGESYLKYVIFTNEATFYVNRSVN